MNIVFRDINDLISAEYNPRQLTNDQFNQISDSIKRFGIVDPIIVNKNKEREDIIIGGHQRIKVAKDLNIEKVPTVELDLNYDKERELNIRLNKNSGDWDYDVLANGFEMDELMDWGFKEDELIGFSPDLNDGENIYTKKVEIPKYEPSDEKPKLLDLIDESKSDSLIEKINDTELSQDLKQFLICAAKRHTIFNYDKIADYYAHSNDEIKDLMEQSALVIIDFEKAIYEGYVELSEEIRKQYIIDNEQITE